MLGVPWQPRCGAGCATPGLTQETRSDVGYVAVTRPGVFLAGVVAVVGLGRGA